MKRYYICDIIGDGSDDEPYRPALDFQGIRYTAVIPSGPDGRPRNTWALVMVAAKDHTPLLASPHLNALPDFPMDGKVSAINNATKNAMKARMAARGIDTAFVDGTDGYRDVIRGLGQGLDPNFNENKFDVADVN